MRESSSSKDDLLEIFTLGGLQIQRAGKPITGLSTRKVEALLVYLAITARPHPREVLADFLWDDRTQSRAMNNLRVSLSNLRKHLGDYLTITRDMAGIDTKSNFELDVAKFESLIVSARGRTAENQAITDDAVDQFAKASAIYQGGFLAGFSVRESRGIDEWISLERERLHRMAVEAISQLVSWNLERGDYATGVHQATRWLQLDPLNEAAHRDMMQLLAYVGQTGAALRQYQECVRVLDEELGLIPSPETKELYEAIQNQQLAPPTTSTTIVSSVEELPPEPGESPFKGLAYYDVDDAHLFFGREKLTAELVSRLKRDRFLTVVGASGSGKSSLVRAGLIPALQSGQTLADGSEPPPGSEVWPVHLITPTAQPLRALALSLTREAESPQATAVLIDALTDEPRCLDIYVGKLLAKHPAQRLLLVVDQFEELFTQCRDERERQAFVNNLLTAVAAIPDSATTIVITLRADFYAHCARYDGLRELLESHQAYIGQMTSEELQQAIQGPAQAGEWTFEPGLVDLLLYDIGASQNRKPEPGALPLLSHALLETWRRRRGREMSFSGYAETGGVRRAIAHTAEAVFNDELTTTQQVIARSLFLRLTELGEGAQDTRRRVALAELIPRSEEATAVEAVLKTLADARLITSGEEGVEVAHEALIREWPRLSEWLAEDREGLRLHRQLTEAARGWQTLERDEGALYRGARLAQAAEWAKGRDKELNSLERDFLEASQALARQQDAERDAQRQRELEAARNLADVEKRRAEAQAQAVEQLRRRRRTLVGALIVTSLLAIVAVFLGFQFRRSALEAGQQNRVALARELASRSVELLESDPELSLLLAMEAARGTLESDGFTTSEAELALYRALSARDQRVLRGHTREIFDLSFSPGGQHVVTASADDTARLWDVEGNHITTLEGHLNTVWAVSFSPDGERILTASDDGTARLWDLEGNATAVLEHAGERLLSASFSPDGQRVLTGSADGTARIWDISAGDGELMATFESRDAIESVHFSPDGTRILTGLRNGEAELWGGQGNLIATLEARGLSAAGPRPSGGPFSLTKAANFSPDGTGIVTGSADGTAYLWDDQGNLVTTLIGHEDWVWAASFSPSGELVVTASADRTARLWDDRGNPLAVLEGHTDQVRLVRFSPDGTQILTASVDGTARLWDLEGNLVATLQGHSDIVSLVDFRPDGRQIVTGSYDGSARLWGVDGLLISRLSDHPAQVQSVSFAPDGERILTTSADGTARLWRLPTRSDEAADLLNTFDGNEGAIWSAVFTPDGSQILTAGDDGTARLWNSEGDLVTTLEGHDGAIQWAVFSPVGDRIVTGGDDGTARLWQSTGTFLLALEGHAGPIRLAAFSPDGSHIVTVGWADVSPRLWDADGNFLLALRGNDRPIVTVRFSPDGQRLITAGQNWRPRLWDIKGNQLASLEGHTNAINSVEINDAGTRILTASDDGSAKLWDADGNLLVTLEGHTDAVLWAGFSPNGRRIATVSRDGTARLWDENGSFIVALTGHSAAIHTASFSPDGTLLATASADGSVAVWRVFSSVDPLLAAADERVQRALTEAECRQYLHLEHCPP